VVGSAAVTLVALRAHLLVAAGALWAAIVYVDGHGIHFAANSIRTHHPTGDVERYAHFLDEEFGHVEWHLGLFLLVGVICLAARARDTHLARWEVVAVAALLGLTFFTNTVEGGDWWLELAAAAVFAAWLVIERQPFVVACAAGFLFGATLIGSWAAWHGGVPQFSQLGWI
jgi:hypothetical protein